MSLSFDIRRRSHNNSKVYVQTTWNTWPKTRALLEKLTSEELLEAAEQARQYRPITNPIVKELLKAITRVGATSAGSNEKKSHMLVELKSSVVYHGCPIIFITLNPGDLYSLSFYTMREKRSTRSIFSLIGIRPHTASIRCFEILSPLWSIFIPL